MPANFEKLFQDLIDGWADQERTLNDPPAGTEELTYINYPNSETYGEAINSAKIELWKNLINYFQSRSGDVITKPEFGKHGTDEMRRSLFKYIADNIDLNPDTSNLQDWNESLQELIDSFIEKWTDGIPLTDEEDGAKVPIDDIKHADAGRYFNYTANFVRPWQNIDKKSYRTVRSDDLLLSAVNSKKNMQFTHTQDQFENEHSDATKWIRLLMPMYKRNVEVEDLNRNFWVIGQVMSAICAFLFGDNNLEEIFEDILKELVGLWENVLYLWVAIVLMTKTETYDNHIEVITIFNDGIQIYKKFDNFWDKDTAITIKANNKIIPLNDETEMNNCIQNSSLEMVRGWISNQLYQRLNYLVKTYPKSNLIILPEIRENNYKHNYYSRVEYPCILYYSRKSGQWTYGGFQVQNENNYTIPYRYHYFDQLSQTDTYGWPMFDLAKDFINFDKTTAIDEDYLKQMYGIRDKEFSVDYIFPLAKTLEDVSDPLSEPIPYYGLLRVIPNISIETYTENDEETEMLKISFQVDDAAASVISTTATNKGLSSSLFFYEGEIALDFFENGDQTIDLECYNSFQVIDQNDTISYYNASGNLITTDNYLNGYAVVFDRLYLNESDAQQRVAEIQAVSGTPYTVGYVKNNSGMTTTYGVYRRALANGHVSGYTYSDPSIPETTTNHIVYQGYYQGELVSCQNLLALPSIDSGAYAYWGTPTPTLTQEDLNGGE